MPERRGRRPDEDETRGAEWHLSALALLNAGSQLVLLGRPGSGKSSFVSFVARCLCAEALGRLDEGLVLLTAPLPEKDKDKSEPQSWKHGALLPVIVTLREFAAGPHFPAPGEKGLAKHLADFITFKLQTHKCEDFAPHLLAEMQNRSGKCLLMLDGLDEVPDADRKREQLKQVVEECAKAFPGCRMLVTSRPYAYSAWRLDGFSGATLAPFTEAQINAFIERWYTHIAPKRRLSVEVAAARVRQLQQVIAGNERLREFAGTPLLLTLMASLHAARSGDLPDKRAELYKDAVDLLLKKWEADKGLTGLLQMKPDDLRVHLYRLAYEAHQTQPANQSVADIPLEKLITVLATNRQVHPHDLADYLNQRAGLLISEDGKVYRFPHRTFQEYMAACHLSLNESGFPKTIANLARSDPERWREVVLLTGGQVSLGGATFSLWGLVDQLCFREPTDEAITKADVWGAHLAGLALAELIDPTRLGEADQAKLSRVQRWLVHILQKNALPATERALAGNALAKLGDPRFNPDAFYLPKEDLLGFVRIPAGKFLMGTRRADIPKLVEQFGGDEDYYEREVEQHEVNLPEFYIARYPVTVAQFQAFVQATNYHPLDEASLRGVSNHPVNFVTWEDVLVYCNWLTEALRAWDYTPEPLKTLLTEKRWVITLPSEAEWEKAACSVLSEAECSRRGRLFAWGDDFDADKANVNDAHIGNTSSVGCFQNGATPEGLLDMTGNVWEWTRSLWGDKPKPDFKYPYNPTDRKREDLEALYNVRRVVRGGSFGYRSSYARCTYRTGIPPVGWFDFLGFRVVASPFRG